MLDNTGSPGRGESIEYVLLEDLPSGAWIANLAALKLHVTEWRNWGGIYVLTRLARDSR